MSKPSKVNIKIKARRLGALLRGHQELDTLGLEDRKAILQAAGNLTKIQDVVDGFILREEGIKRDVVDKAQNRIETPGQKVQMAPDAEIRQQVVAMGNEDIELELSTISAQALFSGRKSPPPGQVAALTPVLVGLDEVDLETE